MGDNQNVDNGTSEQAAIKLLQGADFSGYKTSDTDDFNDETPTTTVRDDSEGNVGVEADADGEQVSLRDLSDPPEDGGEQVPDDKMPAWAQRLEQQIQELRQTRGAQDENTGGGGTDTPPGAGTNNPPPSKQQVSKLQEVKKELEEEIAQNGEDIVSARVLRKVIAALEEQGEPIRRAEANMQQQAQEQAARAERQIHGFFDAAAKQDNAVAKALGANGAKATRQQLETRQAVFETATAMQNASLRAARAGVGKPLTDSQALAKAIQETTGRSVDPGRSQAARDGQTRTRFARPGVSVNAEPKAGSEAAGVQQAHANIRAFLRSRAAEEAA